METLEIRTIRGYHLTEMIDSGGYGDVYRAYQPAVDREVAIKVIRPEYASEPDFIRNFEAEAHIIARLEHPYIIPLFDFWRDPDGAYLVMRWLRGGNLAQRLKERGPLTLDECAHMLDQISAALAIAHRKNIVHRDLKPENILLDDDGNAYLGDFGIARRAGKQAPDGKVSGSAAFISPDQLQGKPPSPQSDVYSLGLLLYVMLTAEHPFAGSTGPALIMKHLSEVVPSVRDLRPELPDSIDPVLQRATAKEHDERYADVRELASDFRNAVSRPESSQMMRAIDASHLSNPYKGLRAFSEADADDFFGREALIALLLRRMSESEPNARFLAVVGPSGSGKSSAVRAGLLPALRQGRLPGSNHWYIVDMVPGRNPLQKLADALLSVAAQPIPDLLSRLREDVDGLDWAVRQVLKDREGELVLLIDQFEEIFTLAKDENARQHVMNLLLHALSRPDVRLRVIVTLRADFLDRPLQYVAFGQLLRERIEFVLPMTSEELESAITGPADRLGLEVESGLVAAMIGDVREEPGALPLLQYALTEVFEQREGALLTLRGYQTLGGVQGALARRAEEVHQALPAEQQHLTRQLFLRLVTLGEGAEDTRRRANRSELSALVTDKITLQAILDAFGRYRLLTFDRDEQTREPTIEIAHEALIRGWVRLRGWINESRNDVRLQRLLGLAADEWTQAQRDPSFLLRGTRLAQYEEWHSDSQLALTERERAYLEASTAQKIAEEAEEAERQAKEQGLQDRAQSRLKLIVAILLVASFIGLGLTGLVFNQSQQAQRERDNAQIARDEALVARATSDANANEARSLALASAAQLALADNDYDLAAVLGLEALRYDDPLQVRLSLASLAYTPGTTQRILADSAVNAVAFSPDAREVMGGLRDGLIHAWDVNSGERLRTYSGHADRVTALASSRDGRWLASASWDGRVRLWDRVSGEAVHILQGHDDTVLSVAFSPDDALLASGASDNAILLWDVNAGEMVRRLDGHEGPVYALAFHPDGSRLVSGADDDTARLWDVNTGESVRSFSGHEDRVTAVAFNPDATRLLTASRDDTLRLWDTATANTVQIFTGHAERVNAAAFSPDGTRLYSGSRDSNLFTWDVATGEIIRRFPQHEDDILGLAISANGQWVATGSGDDSLRVWHVAPTSPLNRLPTDAPITALDLSEDGERWLVGREDGAWLYDGTTSETLRQLSAGEVTDLTFSADGERAAISFSEAAPIVIDATRGETLLALDAESGHTSAVSTLAFTEDGDEIITASWDTRAILWDANTGELIRDFAGGHEDRILSLALSQDGTRLFTGSLDGSMVLWNIANGREIRRFLGIRDGVTGASFLDNDHTLITAHDDGTLYFWNVNNGEPRRRLEGHRDGITGLALHPDESTLLTSSQDDSLILWDLSSGAQIQRFPAENVAAVALHPLQSLGMTGSDAGLAVWRMLPLDQMADWLSANRYLTEPSCEARDLYRLEPLCS